jgi:DNA polymerase-3 subunit delta'
VKLSLDDVDRAQELASPEGRALRAAAEVYARAPLAGTSAETRPWAGLLAAVRSRGAALVTELEARAEAELEMTPRRERKRLETEWTERIRRSRRRVQTSALDLGLQLVALWFSDLMALAWEAEELVRHSDRMAELREDAETEGGSEPARLRAAVELVEETRQRFVLNVTEELALEALAYRLERTLVP